MSSLVEEGNKPFTVADRVQGVVIALVFGGLGVWMWVQPSLSLMGDETASGRGGRKVAGLLRLVDVVWSRPLAVILILLAVMVLFGALTKGREKKIGVGGGSGGADRETR